MTYAQTDRSPRLATAGLAAIALASVMIVALDIHTALRTPDHLRRTISEYGLGPQQWVFGIGVGLLGVGSAAVLVSLLRQGLTRIRSVGSIALTLWVIGLVAVVAAPKQDWANDATLGLSGAIHRAGSAVAFVSLPIAVLAIAGPWVRRSRYARAAFAMGVVSVATVMPFVYALVVGLTTSTPWYRAITLGYVERVLVVAEVLALILLAAWALHSSRSQRAQRVRVNGEARDPTRIIATHP